MSSTCTTFVHLLSPGFYYCLGNVSDHCFGSQPLHLTFQRGFWEQFWFLLPSDACGIHLSTKKVRPAIFRPKSINESWKRRWTLSGMTTACIAEQWSQHGHGTGTTVGNSRLWVLAAQMEGGTGVQVRGKQREQVP